MVRPELQAHRSACLDRLNPRIFAEVIATIALAEECAPKSGPHKIPFSALQAVNARFAAHPSAMRSCMTNMNIATTNKGLAAIGGPLIVSVEADHLVVDV